LVPVVGFWSTRSTIARTELDAAMAGTSRSYGRGLVAGTLPGATAAGPRTTWTLVAGGDVMLDRSIYRRSILQGKGAGYPWDGGFAEITGRRCCTAAGYRLPGVRRAGHPGAGGGLFPGGRTAL